MKTYLREQTARELLINTLEIYRAHIGLLFVIHLIPTLPFNIWSNYLERTTGELFNIGYYFTSLVDLVPTMAIAIAVSDICLGHAPGAFRSYARLKGKRIDKILLTYLAFMAGLFFTFILFVVPGVIFYIWFMFTLTVVVLEGTWGRQAFTRSKALGRGFYWRNLGVMALLTLTCMLFFFVAIFIFEFLAATLPILSEPLVYSLFMSLATSLFVPVILVCTVLLYYDMRVRKEAYNNLALTEDLLR